MWCLGIESSCDDTSIALVKDGALVAHESASQASLHALFGGVVPELASREHARFIGPLCDNVLRGAGLTPSEIDVVSVARGPGLLGSLLVGIAFAKSFALGTGARLIGVNHLHAHLFAAGLEQPVELPALGLLVSGGHTQLCRIDGPGSVRVLGKTLDDAAGEAFDKAGKMLGLPYPAGKVIDELAAGGRADKRLFPRPYLDNDTLDFSFSGLKTAMNGYVAAHPSIRGRWDADSGAVILPEGDAADRLADVCASYRFAVVETLAVKTERALSRPDMRDTASLVLAGGVAANAFLRERLAGLAEKYGRKFIVPSPALCADNGAMIGYLGWMLSSRGFFHPLDLEAVPRGKPVPDDMCVATAPAEKTLWRFKS